MKIVEPRPIELISSNVPEDTAPVWDSSTTYNAGDVVRVQNLGTNKITKLFKSIQDNNTGHYPPDSPDFWVEQQATNRYMMFDEYVNTQTSNSASIDVKIRVSNFNYISLLNLEATNALIEIYEPDTTTLLESHNINLDESVILSWSDYFFGDFRYKKQITIPVGFYKTNKDIHIVLNHYDKAKCGLVIVGMTTSLGCAKFGVRTGILDYSKKETDELGQTYLKQGWWAKRAEVDIELQTNTIDQVQGFLASIRAKPVLFILDDTLDLESLVIYGFYRDFDIVLEGPVMSYCSISIEGLT